jgi:hypothetical protein
LVPTAKKTSKYFPENTTAKKMTGTVERPGRFQFPPAAALITVGGRLMLVILGKLVQQKGGSYLLTDTDSRLFVASESGLWFLVLAASIKCGTGPQQ